MAPDHRLAARIGLLQQPLRIARHHRIVFAERPQLPGDLGHAPQAGVDPPPEAVAVEDIGAVFVGRHRQQRIEPLRVGEELFALAGRDCDQLAIEQALHLS